MAAATEYVTVVQKLYVAYFGRPADPAGLLLACRMLADTNAPTTAEGFLAAADTNSAVRILLEGFGNSAESQAFYSGSTLAERINQIYKNVLGRTAEPGGLAHWTQEISSGRLTLAKAAFAILRSAEQDVLGDGLTVASKIAVATAFTSTLDTPAETAAYVGTVPAANARALLAQVTAATVLTGFQATIQSAIDTLGSSPAVVPITPAPSPGGGGGSTPAPSPPAPAGQTFALTTGNDTTTAAGTAGDDSFTASQTTFTAADLNLNGNGGTDTLELTLTNTLTPGATSNIEIIKINTTTAQTLDASKYAGATEFIAYQSSGAGTVTVGSGTTNSTFMTSGQTASVVGLGNGTANASATFKYQSSVSKMALNVSGGTAGATNITVTGSGIASGTLTSSGAANTLATITLPGTLTALEINATTNLTTTSITGFTSTATALTVKGSAAAVNLGTITANVLSLDSSAFAGSLTSTLARADIIVNAGAGNDTFTTATVLTTGTVNAGAGTDTLILNATNLLNSTNSSRYSGFEAVQINGGFTADMENMAGVSAVSISGGATGTTGFSNLSAAQAASVKVMASTGTTLGLGVWKAGDSGQQDTLKLTFDDGSAGTSNMTVANVSTSGVENLEVTAVDNVTFSALTGGGAFLNSVTLKGSGDIKITTRAMPAANVVINGATATGKLEIDASAHATGIQITGGSGNDILSGSKVGDTLTGGTGSNTFKFSNTGTALPGTSNLDVITDWRTGTNNSIDHTLSLSAATGATALLSFNGTTGIVTFDSSLVSVSQRVGAVVALANSSGKTAVWQQGANAYLFMSDNTAALSNGDVLVQLTGVTLSAGLNIDGGGNIAAIT
jgi:hypothetical protein